MGHGNFFSFATKVNIPGKQRSSFDGLSDEELEAHLAIDRYGNFELTEAIRPSYDKDVVPRQAWRHDTYRDDFSRTHIPVLMAACTRQKLFDVFMDLVGTMGPFVDAVLESSHTTHHHMRHQDLYREGIDLPVLQSLLLEFEDLLVNDGCTGIAILEPEAEREIQLDEHKLLIVYGRRLSVHEEILRAAGIPQDEGVKFITEGEHVHSSSDRYQHLFEELQCRLGLDDES